MAALTLCTFVLAFWLLVQVNGPPGRGTSSVSADPADADSCGDGGDCGD